MKPPTVTIGGVPLDPLAATWYSPGKDAEVTYPAESTTPNDMPEITARPLEIALELPGEDWQVLVEFVSAFTESYQPVTEPHVISCLPPHRGCRIVSHTDTTLQFIVDVPADATFARLDLVHLGGHLGEVSDAYYPFKLISGDLTLHPDTDADLPTVAEVFGDLLPETYDEAYRVFLALSSESGESYSWRELLPPDRELTATTAMRELVGPGGGKAHIELPYAELSTRLDEQLEHLLGAQTINYAFCAVYADANRIDRNVLEEIDPNTDALTRRFASTYGDNLVFSGPVSYLHTIAADRWLGHLPVHMWRPDGSLAISAPLYGDSILIAGQTGLGEELRELGLEFAPITDPLQPIPPTDDPAELQE
ncbi:MAG: hypothetical protein Q4Q03_00530 [Bowdeniella nasicola]|nr:hypothetical protein [Bowdeniella nasicola]